MSYTTVKTALRWLPLLALVLSLGCGGGRMYVNTEADLGFYEKVGVLTFANLTSDNNAAERVTASFTTELLMLNTVAVANAGDFRKASTTVLQGSPVVSLDGLTSEQIFQIGQAAGVQGMFIGAVTQFGMVRSGQEEFPLIAVIVRFVDCQTGNVVWSYETSQKGGPKFPVFSFGETHTLGEMTTNVCRDVARSFGRIAR